MKRFLDSVVEMGFEKSLAEKALKKFKTFDLAMEHIINGDVDSAPDPSLARPAGTGEAVREAQSSGWACPSCTYANPETALTCEVCGATRPKPVFIPPPPPPPVAVTTTTAVPPVLDPGKGDKPEKEVKADKTKGGGNKGGSKKEHSAFYKEHEAEIAALKDFLLSPRARSHTKSLDDEIQPVLPSEMLTDKQLVDFVAGYVPNVHTMYDHSHTSVARLIPRAYREGLPIFYSMPKLKAHLKHAMQFIFAALYHGEANEPTKRRYVTRLCEAFTSCQPEQARVIDATYGALSGRNMGVKEQVLALVDDQKQRVLDQVVLVIHPEAQSTRVPTLQVPHLESAYSQGVGSVLGLRSMPGAAADADHCKSSVSESELRKVVATFRELFSVEDLLEAVVSDVNQQDDDADRLISRDELAAWAGDPTVNNGFESYTIYYDEDRKEDYNDTKPLEKNEYQPFLSKKVVLNLLTKMFCCCCC